MRLAPVSSINRLCLFSLGILSVCPGFCQTSGGPQPAQMGAANAPAAKSQPPRRQLPPSRYGDLMMVRKRYRDAIDLYLEAAAAYPKYLERTGLAWHNLDHLDRAESFYKQALDQNPKDPETLNNLGALYYDQGKYGDARKYFDKALQSSPDSAAIRRNLGSAYFERKQYTKAAAAYAEALRISPGILQQSDDNNWRLETRQPQESPELSFCYSQAYRQAGMSDRADALLAKARQQGFEENGLKDQSPGFWDWLRGIFH
jgi:tetratricopeptide (TPR) repeat protein